MPAPFPKLSKRKDTPRDYFMHFLKFLGAFMFIIAAALFMMHLASTSA